MPNDSELDIPKEPPLCMGRRRFLIRSAAALTTLQLLSPWGEQFTLEAAIYESQGIGKVTELTVGHPVEFRYPWDHLNCSSYLIKLGAPASGGVGPDQDIVAFNTLCTHMGGPLVGQYKPEYQVLGPCPLHFTTFDLTRHGMVVAGHATEALPQIQLEIQGDDILATGVLGLMYGFADNELAPVK